jgi:hypothetical protein
MKYLSKFLLVSIILFLPFKVFAFEFKFGNKYFDYGNGAVNLDLVKYITPKWGQIYTTPYSDAETIFKEYSETPNKNTINQRIEELFDVNSFEQFEFYYLNNWSYIDFDNFQLNILPAEIHFKIPDCSLMETLATENPSFIIFLTKSMEAFEIDENSPDACEKLQNKQNKLTETAVEKIRDGLFDTTMTYAKVVDR